MLKLIIVLPDGSWGSADGAMVYKIQDSLLDAEDVEEMFIAGSEDLDLTFWEVAQLNDEGAGELSMSLRSPIRIKA